MHDDEVEDAPVPTHDDGDEDARVHTQRANDLFSALMAAKASDKVSRRATLYALKAYIEVLEADGSTKQSEEDRGVPGEHVSGQKHVIKKKPSMLDVSKRKAEHRCQLHLDWFWGLLPFFNTCMSSTNSGTPSSDEMVMKLEGIGLLSGLVLTIAMSIPLSFSVEEWQMLQDLYNSTPYSEHMLGFEGLFREVHQFSFWGANACALSVFLVGLLLYGESNSPNDDTRMLYWRYAKVPVAFTIWGTVLGVIFTSMAFNRASTAKSLDLYLEHHGKPYTSLALSMTDGSTYATSRGATWLMAALFSLGASCLSIGVHYQSKEIARRLYAARRNNGSN